ncbi:MAG: LCP family protein, partial [Jiangellaceae bacterium]
MTPSDDRSGQPPSGSSKVTTYRAGHVPGVSYGDGTARSPQDHEGSAPPRQPSPAPAPRRPARRRTSSRAARWFVGILVVLLAALLVLFLLAWSRIDKVDAIPEDHGSAVSEGRVYLLVGSDSREDLSREEQADLGTGSAEGRRTDTIMLLYVPTDGRPALVSVPRDSLVDIPDRGEERINAAFAFGGAPLLVQ